MSFNQWDLKSIGEIGDVITGKTPSTKNEKNFGDMCYFITPRDMTGQKKIDFTERKLSPDGIESVKKQFIKGPAICVSCIGSDMGKVVICENDFVTNQQINTISNIKGNYDIDFLYYSLKPMKDYLHGIAGGSTMPIVNKSTFETIKISVPTLNQQKAIAKVLSDLDEKIEINNKINRKLEEMAQAIFKQWFVDFEFPNEDGKPYKSSGGEMVESELGMIPKGWRQSTLEEVAIMSAGGDKPKCFSKNATEDYDVPIYSNGIDNEGLYGYTDKAKIFEEAITVSARGTIGYVCLRQQPYFPIVRLISLVPHKSIITSKYLYFYLKLINISGTGTTQQQLTVPDFKRTKICIPKYQVIKQFTDMVNDIFRKIEVGKNENMKLAELRDTLLPKLMSGEIRVSID